MPANFGGGRPGGSGPNDQPIRSFQPIYREPSLNGRIVGQRVGLSRHSATGTYPTANGVYNALIRVRPATRNVRIVVWGRGAWAGWQNYPSADDLGGVTVSFTGNLLTLARSLVSDPAYRIRAQPLVGTTGPDLAVADWVFEHGGYDFQTVWAIVVQPMP